MARYGSILEAVGRTPLIELPHVAAESGICLLGKLESANPGGSSKDRIALAMVEDAERSGDLIPGGTIVEATAGNTGVALAMVAATRGYRCLFVLPDKMSAEKVELLRAYGAEIVVTPANVAPDSPENYNIVAERLASQIPGAWRPGQFTNDRNPEAHYLTTGPEIWEDTDGRIEAFVTGIGTGGTISGIGRYLKERDSRVRIVAADPAGSILSGGPAGSWKVEGIGEDFFPQTFDRRVVDDYVRVSDAESFQAARRLAREEGILAGGSSGTAVAAALKYASRLRAGSVVVALMPDTGRNYLSKLFSDDWMHDNGFDEVEHETVTALQILAQKRMMPPLVSVPPRMSAKDAATLLERYGISQLPVTKDGRVLGTVDEVGLMHLLHDGVDLGMKTALDVMGRPLPSIDEQSPVSEVFRLLMGGSEGVIVTREGMALGLLSRSDLVEFWSVSRERASA